MLTRQDGEALANAAARIDDDGSVLVRQHLELGIETSGMSSVPKNLSKDRVHDLGTER